MVREREVPDDLAGQPGLRAVPFQQLRFDEAQDLFDLQGDLVSGQYRAELAGRRCGSQELEAFYVEQALVSAA